MTIDELIKIAIKKLKNSTSPSLDGEVLLSHVLDKPKEYLMTHGNKEIDPKLEKKFLTLLNRRLLGWPVAYLQKQKEFYGLKFFVDKNVLIPRPETEGLVDLVLNYAKDGKNLKILDLGTGSGNIIISIAKNLKSPVFARRSKTDEAISSREKIASLRSQRQNKHKLFASDISPKAINIAKKNAKEHKVKITFGDGDLIKPWGKEKFDIVVANLPYLHRETNESTKYEPKGALIAAKKGLAIYERLLKQTSTLNPLPYALFLEIGRDQGHMIKKLAKKILPAFKAKIFKDLAGRQRYAVLQRAQKSS